MASTVHQPFVPVPNVIRFRYAGTLQGGNWVNGFAAQYAGTTPDSTALNALATTLRGLWNTHLAPIFVVNTQLVTTTVWDISSETGATGSSGATANGTTAAGTLMPRNAAVCVSWPIQVRYRGGHPRTYIVGRNMADLSNGNALITAYHDLIVTAFTNFRGAVNSTALGGANLTLCAVHYSPPRVLPKTSGQPFPVNVPVVHGRLDTQRRRLGKELA